MNQTDKNLERVLNSFPVALVEFEDDDNFTITNVNNEFYSMVECPKSKFKSKFSSGLKKLIYEEDLKKFENDINTSNDFVDTRIVSGKGNVIVTIFKAKKIGNKFSLVFVGSSISFENNSENIFKMKCLDKILKTEDYIVFEYDIKNDFMHLEKKYSSLFGKSNQINKFSEIINEQDFIYDKDIEIIKRNYSDVLEGKDKAKFKIRIKNKNDKYEWNSIVFSSVFDENGNIQSIVGKIHNIDDKIKSKELSKKPQLDELTKLLNKSSTESLINEYLMENYEENISAMFLVNINNFKEINNAYGDMLGAAVLVDIAEIFRGVFKENDIIGRTGENEFVILMKDISSADIVNKKGKILCERISNLYGTEISGMNISASIGITMSSAGVLYKDLFKNANTALYETKIKGKDSFAFYNEKNISKINEQVNEAISTVDIKNIQESVNDLLKNSTNIDEAFDKILKGIVDNFKVSRGYIYLLNKNGFSFDNKYQWCAKNIKTIEGGMKEIPFESDTGDVEYFSLFNRDDIFDCSDITKIAYPFNEYMKLLENLSVLETLIYKNGRPIGFIGVSSCKSRKIWKQNHIDILSVLSKVIGKFINYN